MGWRENFQAMGGHPGFIDMQGQLHGTWLVVERVANNAGGNACWRIKCTVCQVPRIAQGIQIRSSTRLRCYVCRPRKRGRKAGGRG